VSLLDIDDAICEVTHMEIRRSDSSVAAILSVVEAMLKSGAYRAITMDSSASGGRRLLNESAEETVVRIKSACDADGLERSLYIGHFDRVDS
jgi:hypothetical protein